MFITTYFHETIYSELWHIFLLFRIVAHSLVEKYTARLELPLS